jgi:hypothetical protein
MALLLTAVMLGFVTSGCEARRSIMRDHQISEDHAMKRLGKMTALTKPFAALLLAVNPATQKRADISFHPQLSTRAMSSRHRLRTPSRMAGGVGATDFVPFLGKGMGRDKIDSQPLLSMFYQTALKKGMSDKQVLHSFASLAGLDVDSTISSFEKQSTDWSEKLKEMRSRLPDMFESRGERRLKWLCAAWLSILTCELTQFALVSSFAWFVGAGHISWKAHDLPRCAASAGVALQARAPTSVLRLLAEIYTFRRMRAAITKLLPRDRAAFTIRRSAGIVWACAALLAIPVMTEASMVGNVASKLPPAALLWQFFLDSLVRLSGTFGCLKGISARKGAAAVADACVQARSAVQALAGKSASLALHARTVKPIRAMLDLCETDAWAYDACRTPVNIVRLGLAQWNAR